MARKIKVGVIGVGGAGRAHCGRFLRNANVEEVRGYDIKIIDFKDVQIYYDFEEFIDTVDAVSICTPDESHLFYILEAFRRGKHVLVEKPMVASYREVEELETYISKFQNLVFAVHHQMRFVPSFFKTKEVIDSGLLGKIFYVEANYWHDMRLRSIQYDDWRMRGKGQSVIFGGACHPLDLILYLLGNHTVEHTHTYLNKNAFEEYPLKYTAATTILGFSNGVVAKCHTNI